jgi:DNA segregation ATPase FtsK/SpoIIIE, S-DNA-T family
VGRGVSDIPPIAGRGFIAVDRSPLEIQVGITVKASEDEMKAGLDDNKKLSQLIASLRHAWGEREKPQPIEMLRTNISLRSILPTPARKPARVSAFIGTQDIDLRPLVLDLAQRGPHFMLIGPPISGKTSTLRTFVTSIASLYTPQQAMIVLVDFQQRFYKYGGKRTLADLPHVVTVATEGAHLEQAIKNLRAEYETPDRDLAQHPRPEIFFVSDNYDDYASVIGASTSTKSTAYKDLAELARKQGPEGFHAIICGSAGILRMMDDFTRQVSSSRYGLGLDSGDAAGALGGRVRGGGQEEFPPGRGYIVRAGRSSLVQVATPQEGDSYEESLDGLINEVVGRYKPAEAAKWYLDLRPELRQVAPVTAPAPTAPARATNARATTSRPAVQAPPESDEIAKLMAEQKEAEEQAKKNANAMADLDALFANQENKPFNMSKPVAKPVAKTEAPDDTNKK